MEKKEKLFGVTAINGVFKSGEFKGDDEKLRSITPQPNSKKPINLN